MNFNGPFLTDIDPQAVVKGSRDPLGIQSIWARLGRHVVGNLTTVTTSVRDFTTLVLGYHFAERVANEIGGDGDLAVFLRWEQLAAYARLACNHDDRFRGIDRAKKNLQNGTRIRLGADPASQILSNQKTYGIWGLYTVSARSSGLVEGDPTRLTREGHDLIDRLYLPIFAEGGLRNADAVVTRLAKSTSNLDAQKADLSFLKTIAKVLDKSLRSEEREVYRNHLLLGGPNEKDRTGGRQEILAEAINSTLDDKKWTLSPSRVRHLAKLCRVQGDVGVAVAERLERIRTAELLLAPAAALFSLTLASDGQTIAELSDAIRRQWGNSVQTIDVEATAALETELQYSTAEPDTGQRWVRAARALASGDFERALKLLIEQNSFIMKSRAAAAPWVDVTNGRLRVRFRDDNVELPKKTALPEFWSHSYFLDSIRAIALALKA